jgi:hypothetical protein
MGGTSIGGTVIGGTSTPPSPTGGSPGTAVGGDVVGAGDDGVPEAVPDGEAPARGDSASAVLVAPDDDPDAPDELGASEFGRRGPSEPEPDGSNPNPCTTSAIAS